MKWYEGGIAEAVSASKKKGAVFVVYIEGVDETSKRLTELLQNPIASEKIDTGNFVAIKIEENSVPHQQFSQIYKEATSPSLFFIGRSGIPLQILDKPIDEKEFLKAIDTIIEKNNAVSPKTSPKSDTENFIKTEIKNEVKVTENDVSKNPLNDSVPNNKDEKVTEKDKSPIKSEEEEMKNKDISSIEVSSNDADNKSALNEKDEKLKLYKGLIEKKQEEKSTEEKEKEKENELRRRKLGQDVQKLKRWQEEQELKNLVERREKEKREEQEARQRVLAQIAQDKAERAARFANVPNYIAPPSPQIITPAPRPTSGTNIARLQLKLPDGSSHTHEFASGATLQDVREFISANLNMAFNTYTLSTMFPRREFTDTDYEKTLLDLELVPNAVVLILPINQGVVPSSYGGGRFLAVFWFFVGPIFNMLMYLKTRIFGGSGRSGSTGILTRSQINAISLGRVADAQLASTSTATKKRMGDSTVIRREGNIHRLADRDSKDDDNNTWNGNSTQQM